MHYLGIHLLQGIYYVLKSLDMLAYLSHDPEVG